MHIKRLSLHHHKAIFDPAAAIYNDVPRLQTRSALFTHECVLHMSSPKHSRQAQLFPRNKSSSVTVSRFTEGARVYEYLNDTTQRPTDRCLENWSRAAFNKTL